MKARQISKNQRNKRLLALWKKYNRQIASVPSLERSFKSLQDLLNDVSKNNAVATKDLKAFTKEKSVLRDNLNKSSFLICSALFSLALDLNKSDMQAEYDYTISFFNKLAEKNIIDMAGKLLSKAKENPEKLASYDITPEILSGFEKDIRAFEKAVKTWKSQAETIKKAYSEVENLLRQISILITKEIDKKIFSFKITDPAFYNEYIAVKKLDEEISVHEISAGDPESPGKTPGKSDKSPESREMS